MATPDLTTKEWLLSLSVKPTPSSGLYVPAATQISAWHKLLAAVNASCNVLNALAQVVPLLLPAAFAFTYNLVGGAVVEPNPACVENDPFDAKFSLRRSFNLFSTSTAPGIT